MDATSSRSSCGSRGSWRTRSRASRCPTCRWQSRQSCVDRDDTGPGRAHSRTTVSSSASVVVATTTRCACLAARTRCTHAFCRGKRRRSCGRSRPEWTSLPSARPTNVTLETCVISMEQFAISSCTHVAQVASVLVDAGAWTVGEHLAPSARLIFVRVEPEVQRTAARDAQRIDEEALAVIPAERLAQVGGTRARSLAPGTRCPGSSHSRRSWGCQSCTTRSGRARTLSGINRSVQVTTTSYGPARPSRSIGVVRFQISRQRARSGSPRMVRSSRPERPAHATTPCA